MTFRSQFNRLLDRLGRMDHSGSGGAAGAVGFLESSRLVSLLIFAATVAAIVLISFVGVTTANLPVLPNQLANVRIVASVPFSYVSKELTQVALEERKESVSRVYRLEAGPLNQFESHLDELLAALDRFQKTYPAGIMFLGNRDADLAAIVDAFNAKGPYQARISDIETLLAVGNAATLRPLIDHGVALLRNLYADGVQDGRIFSTTPERGQLEAIQVARADGTVAARSVQSMEGALASLRADLVDQDGRPAVSAALYNLLSNGLVPSLVYDAEATRRHEEEAIASLPPVTVKVERGQTIIEPGRIVTPEQFEMLAAHRQALLDSGDAEVAEGLQLFYRVLLVLAMVMASVIYIRLEDRATLHSNVRLALLALVVVFNLALVRLTYALTGLTYFIADPDSASLLPYLAPTAIAPLFIAILIDAGSASFAALLISIFTSVIFGNRLDLLVVTFLGSMVAIHGSRPMRKRSQIVRASALGGLTVAGFALFLGVVDKLEPLTVLKHMGTGLGTGVLTGVIVVGMLPMLEALFKRTTDITFLELTDYNHPLLRLMQLEAPGTYHHSLMVAQLAENAASDIGANPLLTRVCALFHDIGKTVRPEHFGENLRAGQSPHDSLAPTESANVIRDHVPDGVALAVKHRLPRAVIDVIRQHHGTTLVRYFYQRAVDQSRMPFPVSPSSRAGRGELAGVIEANFRYEGPRPRFKESAIIHLADAVEATSRSLRVVDPAQLDALIERLVRDRVADRQLEEAPITFEELSRIKASFARTLLNMLHSRIEYPTHAPAPEGNPSLATDAPKV